MDPNPTTLEAAIEQIEKWREWATARMAEIQELNAEITRLSALPSSPQSTELYEGKPRYISITLDRKPKSLAMVIDDESTEETK
jgi:hypothetical protein